MKTLPEFRVTLTRVTSPQSQSKIDGVPFIHRIGQRTKLGGQPDRIQDAAPWPTCPFCRQAMTFVAQIDSVEHFDESNPHAVDCHAGEQQWMFSDAGMLYLYYCFECGQTASELASY